ncbi:unnamed protein product [Chrysoparadoxa australica]
MPSLPPILQPTEDDIQKMLAASVHIGTRNSDDKMKDYIWRRRQDGIHILNIGRTWEKLVLAARIIVAIENPKDVIAISARPYGQRAVLKFAHYTGAASIAGRFTPGTFTNQITKQFREPRLLIITDPRTDAQAVKEASYVNVPVIALCDSESPTQYVDVAIPANNKGKLSIGLLYWMLAREVLRLRGTVSRSAPWDVPVDLFFYSTIEELEKQEADQQAADAAVVAAPAAWGAETTPETYAAIPDQSFGAPPQPVAGEWDGPATPAVAVEQPAAMDPAAAAAGTGWDSQPAAAGAPTAGWDQPTGGTTSGW